MTKFFAGLGIGVCMGLVLAPTEGWRMRKKIVSDVEDVGEKLGHIGDLIPENLDMQSIRAALPSVSDMAETLRSVVPSNVIEMAKRVPVIGTAIEGENRQEEVRRQEPEQQERHAEPISQNEISHMREEREETMRAESSRNDWDSASAEEEHQPRDRSAVA